MNKKERPRELEALAAMQGWDFAPTATTGSVSLLQRFEFPNGEKRVPDHLENVITGTREQLSFAAFDVVWKTPVQSNGDGLLSAIYHKDISARTIRAQTMFSVESERLTLPDFHIFPNESVRFLDRIVDRGFHNVAIPGYPAFGSSFCVRPAGAADEDIIRILSREAIENIQKNGAVSYFFYAGGIASYRAGEICDAAAISGRVESLLDLIRTLEGNTND